MNVKEKQLEAKTCQKIKENKYKCGAPEMKILITTLKNYLEIQ